MPELLLLLLLNVIYDIGIRGPMAFFIVNFLRDRRFRTRVGQELSDTHLQDEGVPQGSVLSFTLFSLAINNITSNLPRDIQSSPYVDDLVIYLTSNYLPSVERPQQHVINCISTWASNHGFTISENETIAVHFDRKRGHAEPSLSL